MTARSVLALPSADALRAQLAQAVERSRAYVAQHRSLDPVAAEHIVALAGLIERGLLTGGVAPASEAQQDREFALYRMVMTAAFEKGYGCVSEAIAAALPAHAMPADGSSRAQRDG